MITIHSDDFGYKSYSDKKIVQLLRKDRIKSVSVLINMCNSNSLKSLIRLVQSKPEIKIGLHLNLIEGKSIEGKEYVPTLVSGRGNLFPLKKFIVRLALRMISPSHIEREMRSQVKALKKTGLKISFIDSHQHLHAISPVSEIVDKISKEENIKIVRSYKTVRTYTLIAKLKYLFLKSAASFSYILLYGKLGLPVCWITKNEKSYSFMSWESNRFDANAVKDKSLVFVAHPYLPFDTNLSYMWMI